MPDSKSPSDPRDQEQAVERRPYPHDPTRVENQRVSDASTMNNGGLGGGRPGGGSKVTPERARTEGTDQPADPALPADDATLDTKI
ncbi:MAG: hypothetical protein HOQ29_18355 [Acidobacteria bacterium]|nr:hypothetical protein [Acidobacteriota bacterium]